MIDESDHSLFSVIFWIGVAAFIMGILVMLVALLLHSLDIRLIGSVVVVIGAIVSALALLRGEDLANRSK